MKNFFLAFIIVGSLSAHAQPPAYVVSVDDSDIQGYYFLRLDNTPAILDARGNIIYYFHPADSTVINGYFGLLPGGRMTLGGVNKYIITDSAFHIIDSDACKNYRTDSHEFLALPNGHFMLIGEDTTRADVSHYFFRGRRGSTNARVRWAVIQELDEQKNIVWQWSARNYFTVEDADTFYLDDPNNLDINHANSLDVDADGNILLSSRNMNEITKINRGTGKIMWRLGGNHNQFKMIDCPLPFYAQHDARRIANGNITLFDNGENKVSHGARGLEFKIDEKKKTATLVWSYQLDTLFCGGWGNVQRLKNSNTVVSYGKTGSSKTCFVVVSPEGHIKFQLDKVSSYRVLYYSSLPWQVHRPRIRCVDSLGVTYLDVGANYKSYKWNTGAITRLLPITKAGSYWVFVPYGDRGFISSEKVTVTDVANPCAAIRQSPFTKGEPVKK